MAEITEEEKAQARADAGIFDDVYPEPDPVSNGAPEEDPVALLRQRYQAGDIDDETLDREIRKIAEKRVGPLSLYPKWERVLDAINVGIKAAIYDYLNSAS